MATKIEIPAEVSRNVPGFTPSELEAYARHNLGAVEPSLYEDGFGRWAMTKLGMFAGRVARLMSEADFRFVVIPRNTEAVVIKTRRIGDLGAIDFSLGEGIARRRHGEISGDWPPRGGVIALKVPFLERAVKFNVVSQIPFEFVADFQPAVPGLGADIPVRINTTGRFINPVVAAINWENQEGAENAIQETISDMAIGATFADSLFVEAVRRQWESANEQGSMGLGEISSLIKSALAPKFDLEVGKLAGFVPARGKTVVDMVWPKEMQESADAQIRARDILIQEGAKAKVAGRYAYEIVRAVFGDPDNFRRVLLRLLPPAREGVALTKDELVDEVMKCPEVLASLLNNSAVQQLIFSALDGDSQEQGA